MYKSPYTISIWDTSTSPETKICNIGSDKMTISARALEPKLQRNINGKMSFSFKMYSDCYDSEIQDNIIELLDYDLNYLTDSENVQLLASFFINHNFVGNYKNPFLSYLINERLIKVYWEDEWYDFVIKNIQEDSAAKSYIFQCESWLVQELSKQGFNLEFDEKLRNNQGTYNELASRILENTAWSVDTLNSDIGYEYNKEAVYEVTNNGQFSALYLPDFTTVTIPTRKKILVFFSDIMGLKEDAAPNTQALIQFVYAPAYERENNSMMIKDSQLMNYQVNVTYTYNQSTSTYTFTVLNSSTTFSVSIAAGTSPNYRAKKLINSLYSIYDPITDKYCYVLMAGDSTEERLYTVPGQVVDDPSPSRTLDTSVPLFIQLNGELYPIYLVGHAPSGSDEKEHYQYKTTQSNFANYVQNLIANGQTFTNSDGWRKVTKITNEGEDPSYEQDELIPYIDTKNVASYIQVPETANEDQWIFNSSIRSSRNFVKYFIYGETYYLRAKIYEAQEDSEHETIEPSRVISPQDRILNIKIAQYVESDKFYPKDDESPYFTQEGDWVQDPNDQTYYYLKLKCVKGLSLESTLDCRVGLYFKTSETFFINEIQLFKETLTDLHPDAPGITPGEFDAAGVLKTVYCVYNHTDYETAKNADQIVLEYKGEKEPLNVDRFANYKYKTTEFQKVRTITGKESNRFNLLQSLAEKFECWCVPYATHTSTGAIENRYVKFVETLGEDQNIGFIYGLDLKTVKRTVDSKQIVTKTVVKANSNKYAENQDGSCNIARAQENYPRVNYVLNFDYYVNQGLLSNEVLSQALYSVNPDSLGYYTKLHTYNLAYDAAAANYKKYKTQFDALQSYLKVYKQYKENAESEKYSYMLNLFNLWWTDSNTNSSTERESLQELWDRATSKDRTDPLCDWYLTTCYDGRNANPRPDVDKNAWKYSDGVTKAIEASKKYDTQIKNIENALEELKTTLTAAETEMETQLRLIHAADLQFQESYGQFIQEGTWSSEDYMNDSLYYLDALDVAYTSARPRITYSIDVLRLNALPEFKVKVFKLGDIAYVEDTEFFGYTTIGNVKMPYHEKVVLTELTQSFDDPSKDQFKVQNYRTQFEDLFQRITATTQTLQWNEADYGRAVDAVEKDQTINTDILQSSFTNAQNLVRASLNNSVTQDATGISIINQTDPLKQSHINAEGFFISTDGGDTWRNAVSAEGVATELLTAGEIDTSKISIMDGNWEAFRWDNTGLNAYAESQQVGYTADYGTFVRFDKWGIYGNQNQNTSWIPIAEASIWDSSHTRFALTWGGLCANSSNGTTSVIVGAVPTSVAVASGSNYGFMITQNTVDTANHVVTGRTPVFYADESGNLNLSGKLVAATGSFSGAITATSGYIGGSSGFTIESQKLYTTYVATPTTYYAGIYTNNDPDTKVFYAGANNPTGTGATFFATASGYVEMTSGHISGSVKIDGTAEARKITVLRAGTEDQYLFNADADNHSVQIGGWSVDTSSLSVNDNELYLGSEGINIIKNEGAVNEETIENVIFKAGDNFFVTKNGTLYAYSGKISGSLISEGINANNITAGTLSGAAINIGKDQFVVNSSGAVTANNINVRGGSLQLGIGRNGVSEEGTLIINSSGFTIYGSEGSFLRLFQPYYTGPLDGEVVLGYMRCRSISDSFDKMGSIYADTNGYLRFA